MIEAYPIFLIPATAAGVIAPAHATVLSIFARFRMPSTFSFFTCDCAAARQTLIAATAKIETNVFMFNSSGCVWNPFYTFLMRFRVDRSARQRREDHLAETP